MAAEPSMVAAEGVVTDHLHETPPLPGLDKEASATTTAAALALTAARPENRAVACPNCGGDCWHEPAGYPWCRPCGDHHRPPECAVDEQGRSLMSCGCAWLVVEAAGSSEAAHYAPGCYVVRDRNDAD